MSIIKAALTAGAIIVAACGTASAQTQPLKIVVPFAVGGSTDVVARVLAEALRSKLGRSVIVENRTGSGVVAGTHAVAQAAPDGNTVLFATVAHAINPTLMGSLPYDSDKDFIPVAHVANVPMVLSINPSVPASDLQSFLQYLRDKGGQVNYGSAGIGSALHMAVELMKNQAKVEAVHIPYRGAGPAMNDLIAGHVQFIIDPISTSASQIEGGKIRPIAVTSAQRSPALPKVPTFKEAGMKNYEAYTWNVILAPRGTPRAFVDTLNKAVNAALAEAAVKERFAQLTVEAVIGSTPDSTAAFLTRESEKWGTLIKNAGITVDR